MNDDPSFDDAARQFVEFLSKLEWPTDVVWLRPGDLLHRGRRLAVRAGALAGGDAHARAQYEHAVALRSGVVIDAVCLANGRTLARVARPVSADAASRNLVPKGLKLRVPTERLVAEVVTSSLRWWWRSLTWRAWPEDDGDLCA